MNPLDAAFEELVASIESPDQLRLLISELALACWEDSDQTTETLTALIGAIETAKQVLFMHLGDRFNDE